jgi:hypothetical protein
MITTNKKAIPIDRNGFVPRTGFEPAHLTAPPPEDGASTNFATWAESIAGCELLISDC